MEQLLLQYYLLLKTPIPEGGAEWNLSPEYHYLFGFAVRDFLRRSCRLFQGIQVCNVGIGVGELYMGTTEIAPATWFEEYLHLTSHVIEQQQQFDYYPEMVGYAYLVGKTRHEP